ncbi:MAG TPA: M61 family peptidase [Thermoanaerobaculia bacterium]|nr:M61 family peptidase [Thermoanaerobaculia bacterium]
MKPKIRRPRPVLAFFALTFALAAMAATAATPETAPIALSLDASQVAQRLLHVSSEIPVAPGPLTLLYPKWIPGEHGPTGPVVNLVDLHLSANGKELAWQRDPVEMYALHVVIPAGATRLATQADFLFPGEGGNFSSGPGATDALAVLSWNTVALYPQGPGADVLRVAPTLRLPAGWKYATALAKQGEEGGAIRFATVSLTTLVDSPVLAGEHLVDLDLGVHDGAAHHLAITADRAADLAGAGEMTAPMRRLVAETLALFGARHYDSYRWLLTLSDHVEHFGLEHHESSDDRVDEETLVKEAAKRQLPGLLAHEFVHSWNGKYRRPEGLLSPDYQRPMKGELLWVYEGLTEHLGYLLPARAGLWTPEYYREQVASIAATLDTRTGRNWRPLGDTATAAQMLYGTPSDGRARRRSTDFYDESVFLWLDVDTLLRERSQGRVTLDDFCHRFHGGTSSGPALLPYTRDDVVKTLNALVPYDWQGLFAERVDRVAPRLPMAGFERAGWRLVYNDKPNAAMADDEARHEDHDWRFSLGFAVDKKDVVSEVLPDSPAGRAGLVVGEKVLGVGGHVYSARAVEAALAEAKGGKAPLEVVVADGDALRTHRLDYHDGLRYPHLERIEGRPDVLADILKARAQ